MSRYVVTATWDDVPHLAEAVKAELAASIPPWQRDARCRGVPQLGAGAIYPVVEADVMVDDFALPAHWPRCYGLDVGWNATAAVWGAINRDTDTIYLYAEHLRGEAEPAVHAAAIQLRGRWIPGVIDPASRGRAQKDGLRLLDNYLQLGLDLEVADHAVEAGLERVWTRLSTGRLKVFKSLVQWWQEYRIYRRDDQGRVVKQRDHLMDATRYLVMSALGRARTEPKPAEEPQPEYWSYGQQTTQWMG